MPSDPIQDAFAAIRDQYLGGRKIRREQFAGGATVVVSASAITDILPMNPNRVAWLVSNKDTTNIVDVDPNAPSATQGTPLAPNGVMQSKFKDDGETVWDAQKGLARVAGVTLYRTAWEFY